MAKDTVVPKAKKPLFESSAKKSVKVTGQSVKTSMPSGAVQNKDTFYRP